MKDFLAFGLIVELVLLHCLIKQHLVFVGGESRKVPQSGRINATMRILEPFVDRRKAREYTRGVAVYHVYRGHVAFALVSAQVEAQILMVNLHAAFLEICL